MAVGFGDDDSHLETIQATIDNAIDFARSQLSTGESRLHCLDCGSVLLERRRNAIKGCRYCIACQEEHDKGISSYYNRRGSKDSQLR